MWKRPADNKLTWPWGKSPCSIGDTSSNASFSNAILVHLSLIRFYEDIRISKSSCSRAEGGFLTPIQNGRKLGQTKPPNHRKKPLSCFFGPENPQPFFLWTFPGKISVQVDGVQLHGVHLSESSDDSALRRGQHGMTNLLLGKKWLEGCGNLGSIASKSLILIHFQIRRMYNDILICIYNHHLHIHIPTYGLSAGHNF